MNGLWGLTGVARISAHRGVHSDGVAENSLVALERGAAMGVDVVESDARRTRDGVIVIHHNATVADGRSIAQLDYAELPPLADGQRIPTLDEFARRAAELHQFITVEIKEPGYERELVDQLTAAIPDRRFELTSFHAGALRTVEQYDPTVSTGLFGLRLPPSIRSGPIGAAFNGVCTVLGLHPSLLLARWAHADYISDLPAVIDQGYVTDAHTHGLRIQSASSTPTTMARLLAEGVDGLLTDKPALALAMQHRSSAIS